MLLFACASQTHAHSAKQRRVDKLHCTTDGLIHAEVSPEISQKVVGSIRLLEPGARVREAAKLTLPCGFHLDARYGSLVLTNGIEVRRYIENNAFGFAPPFGFSQQATKSYTLNYRLAAVGELRSDGCGERLRGIKGARQSCSSFGSETSFFGTRPYRGRNRVAHFVSRGTAITEDFPLADVDGRVESIFFLPVPDAPGGTITLIQSDAQGMFRTYIDTPKG
jgi:hypothetical protein